MQKYLKLIYNTLLYKITNKMNELEKNNYLEILTQLVELNNLIDLKCIKIQEQNDNENDKINRYKILMENIILDYHNFCKKIFIK
jgi:hypothetical protein